MNLGNLLTGLLLLSALTAEGRISALAPHRCGGVHGATSPLTSAVNHDVQRELDRFRREFARDFDPQDAFVVGVGTKTSALIASLQTLSPDYAVNAPVTLPARYQTIRDLDREDLLKFSDYLDTKLPRLRTLSHRTIVLLDSGGLNLSLLRDIVDRHYRQYGLRIDVVAVRVRVREEGTIGSPSFTDSPSTADFAISRGLAFEVTAGGLSRLREHESFDPDTIRPGESTPRFEIDANYAQVVAILRAQYLNQQFHFSP